jgi:hypothetical protein
MPKRRDVAAGGAKGVGEGAARAGNPRRGGSRREPPVSGRNPPRGSGPAEEAGP